MALSLLLACAVVVECGRTMIVRGSGDGVWVVVTGCGVNCLVTYLQITPRVYPYPRSRVRVYVGSDIPYPDPDPPYPYLCTPGVSKTLAQHYSRGGNLSLIQGIGNTTHKGSPEFNHIYDSGDLRKVNGQV
jgi:hypothetical protein